jgi:ClpP class serine protease
MSGRGAIAAANFRFFRASARSETAVLRGFAAAAHRDYRAEAEIARDFAGSPSGTDEFPRLSVYRYIDVNDSEEVLRAIHITDATVPIDLVLHTPGGLVLAAPDGALSPTRPSPAGRRVPTGTPAR